MWARRFVSLNRVALISFLFAASFALASPRAASARQQTTAPKAEPQKAEQSQKVEPPQQRQTQSQQQADGPQQKATVPAANGRASSSSAPPDASGPAVQVSEDDERKPVITHTDLVTLTVTVTDTYGRFVTGLAKNAFTITDDKDQQEITFFSDEDAPVSLGVVFDVSGSMGGDKINKAREALAKFIETSHSRDEYFLIGFNQRAQLLLDHTRDSDALMQKLTFVQTHGQTALYDAVYLGVNKVTRGVHPKKAILLISDGQDNSSRYTFSELRRILKESDVIIYAVGIVDSHDNNDLGYGGRAILEELAGVSGGKAFFPSSSAEMNDTFERIALELRTQYSIGYRPSKFANDGRWHRLKIKVQPPRGFPRLFVRGREGYFANNTPRN
ncbi:MAG: VWA domain-containing protein [Acidobacteria bacterium]|nr:MAG: VWA domain-containing protein [Acidobacteriota bacterium]PYS83105.1 MAG: VWA domain-containing protein [Acidobacteriota bacterium]